MIRVRKNNSKSSGSLGCGCFLMIFVLFGWGFSILIFPKLPDYEETLERGDVVPGEVLRVETVENITINGRHPRRVVYRYGEGEGREASLLLAMDQSAKSGQPLDVRVLGENAYPEGLRPFAKPKWLQWGLIGVSCFAGLLITTGILRLLLIGGVLIAVGRSLLKKEPTPPSPPPFNPPG